MKKNRAIYLLCLIISGASSYGFESDELIVDDEEFGLVGRKVSDFEYVQPFRSPIRKKIDQETSSGDSKVQFILEHAYGNSDFSIAGIFTARLKTWSHGGQTLTKVRLSRNGFTEKEKEYFEELLKGDEFYRIRLPSNVLNPPGKGYIISSIKARCLPRIELDEHFVIHMEGVNILAINYGSTGTCPYPRPMKLPAKWSFNSYTVLKNSEQAPRYCLDVPVIAIKCIDTCDHLPWFHRRLLGTCRTPAFTEETLGVNGEDEGVKPPEKSFWAKYWMYMIPLGLIVMNAITQAMNMPEEQAAGQSTFQLQQPSAQRALNPAVRGR